MKRVLIIACLLAIVAILVVPMAASAATTKVGGTVKYATVTVVAPKAITWSTFAVGGNLAYDNTSTTQGKVTVIAGTSGTISATVTAKSDAAKAWLFKDATNRLDEFLLISLADSQPTAWAQYHIVNGGSCVAGEYAGAPAESFSGDATKTLSEAGVFAPGTSKTMNYNFWAYQWITANDAANHAGTYSVDVTFTAAAVP